MKKLRNLVYYLKPDLEDLGLLASFEFGYNLFGFEVKPLGTLISIPVVYLAIRIMRREYDYLKDNYTLRKRLEEEPILV